MGAGMLFGQTIIVSASSTPGLAGLVDKYKAELHVLPRPRLSG